MDAGTITSIIGSLGFPIAAAVGLFWYMIKQDEKHREEINGLREAVNNNTLVIQKLLDKMGDES